jgi:hypothetical protein
MVGDDGVVSFDRKLDEELVLLREDAIELEDDVRVFESEWML